MNEEMKKLVEQLYSAAISGIQHVGRANYADREREALKWVRDAMREIDDARVQAGGRSPD